MNSHFETIITKLTSKRDQQHRVSIDEIAAEERPGKDLIGKAFGRDLGHCVYLGAKHGKNFLERVKWYYMSNEEEDYLREIRKAQPETILVEFYGEEKHDN